MYLVPFFHFRILFGVRQTAWRAPPASSKHKDYKVCSSHKSAKSANERLCKRVNSDIGNENGLRLEDEAARAGTVFLKILAPKMADFLSARTPGSYESDRCTTWKLYLFVV